MATSQNDTVLLRPIFAEIQKIWYNKEWRGGRMLKGCTALLRGLVVSMLITGCGMEFLAMKYPASSESDGSTVTKTITLAAKENHTCALSEDKKLKCWGYNASGQLGLGDALYRGDGAGEMGSNLPEVSLGTNRTAKQISLGMNHTCAILDNDTLKCWGYGFQGQLGKGNTSTLGDGANEMGDNLTAIDLGTGYTAKQVATGSQHTCAILNTNEVKCWGGNGFGQLGLGHTDNLGNDPNEMGDNLPVVDLGTGRTAKQIAIGNHHTCVILDNNQTKCWGYNLLGQLGLGHANHLGNDPNEMGDNLSAIDLGTGRTAKQIIAGEQHTCAVLDNNQVKCWGSGGRIGSGAMDDLGNDPNEMGDNLAALDLGSGRTAIQIASGTYHACAVLDNYELKCWGHNASGKLGQGHTNDLGDGAGEMGDSLTAISVGTGRTVKQVVAAFGHTCAGLDNGDVKCWGGNGQGQLGQGNTNSIGDGAGEMGDSLAAISLGF